MSRRSPRWVLGLALLGAVPGQAADPERGALLYAQRCTRCHSLDANKIGPAHRGVVGRMAGSAPGFAYSPALKAAGFVWTAAALDNWLQGPAKLVPGARMFFAVADAGDRADIIAYLGSVSPH